MGGLLRNLFRKINKISDPSQTEGKRERPPNNDNGYMRYCIELEQALRDLETYLLTCDDPKEIAMQALKTACTFYGGDWAGTIEVDLDFDVWAPVWWYNPGIQDRTNQLILEFESSDSMSRWIDVMRIGKNIVIPDVKAIQEDNPEEYAVYERLFVRSLIAVPFIPSPTGFLVIRNPSRYIDRSSMLSALAHVLHHAMAQQKAIESAKLAPTPDLVTSSKDVAINFFGDMEICTKKGILSERFFNSPKSSRVITYIILTEMLNSLQAIRNRRMLWSLDVIELNKQISELTSQNQMLATLKQQGLIDPDIFISQNNELTEQLRTAKLKKERLLVADGDSTIAQTRELMEILDAGPDFLDDFDAELFGELVEKIIVDSSEQLRFRLKNGLELVEIIERTVR